MRTYLAVILAACSSAPRHVDPETRIMPADHPSVVGPVPQPAMHGKPPVAAPKPVTDTYHGTAVVDPYRWLEADDEAVSAWSRGQNTSAREQLDHLPEVDKLHQELHDILAAPSITYGDFVPVAGKLFGLRKQPTHEQPELIVLDDPTKPATAHLVIDPTAAGGAQQSIDWAEPAPDGKKLAVSLSRGGSEQGELHVVDLDGKDLEPPIPNVQRGTGGGDVAWTPDSKGFYYTRYPAAGEKPEAERDFWMQVWFHQLGTAVDKDRYEVGKDLPKIAEIVLESDHRGRVIASAQNGDGGTFRHYLRDKQGWRQLDDWSDAIVDVTFGPTDELWLISRSGAERGKVMKLAASAKTTASAKLVIPETKDALVTDFHARSSIVTTEDRLFLQVQLGGPSELRAFTLDGKPAKAPPLPPVASVGPPVPWKTGILYGANSYTTPWHFHLFDPHTGAVADLDDLSPKPAVDLSAFEVSREFATSKDGTKVPLNIIWPKGAPKDGSTPCVVTGYGGYGINESPWFVSAQAPMLRRGVCFVDVNLRGGGEYGDAWHKAGALTHKQNVFDDFTAALEYLIAQKYTSSAKLGIIGGSNGGLLMGATLVQHPQLMHVVVSLVGVYDMLRVETSSNGAYNVTEYGTVADADQFKALYAYSPYHHAARASYPAILMTTGANDPRVSPWQSRKMIASLQAAQTGDAPILLRTSDAAGHGIGSSMTERIDLETHVQAFLLSHLVH